MYTNFGGNTLTGSQVAQQISAHAAVGGITAVAQGGKFGHGFLSAGITKGITGAVHGGPVAVRLSASMAIGGTVSKISGGKFANGAKTAAFQFMFNEWTSKAYPKGGCSGSVSYWSGSCTPKKELVTIDEQDDGRYLMCAASCVEQNRFDIDATLATLVGAGAGVPIPKTESELKRGGADKNSKVSRQTTRLSRAGLKIRSKYGKSSAPASKALRNTGRVMSRGAVPLLIFEGFFDLGVVGACAVKCSGE